MVSYAKATPQQGPIRVLMANVTGRLGEEVSRVVQQQSDMVLVGVPRDRVELLAAARQGVDIIVLDAPRTYPAPGVCSHLLTEYPDLRIVVLSTEGEGAMVYWRDLRWKALQPISAEMLSGAVRTAYGLNPTA